MEPSNSPADSKIPFKPKEAEVDHADPFSYDCLNRKDEIVNLIHLLANSESPLVLAIDAPWGSGKTTFMKMWRTYLSREEASCATVYFSAWETDLSDDPLHVFLGEINEQLASKTSGMTRFKWDKAMDLAGRITKRTLPALAKIATYGALDLQDVDKGIERVLAELSGGIVSDGLETYKASVSAINQFKENLAFVLADIGKSQSVMVFVDELDRCRPQYAIALLERIKHLLSLPGIIFVLGIDRTQLANAIRGVYGDHFDSETYLQRFIDLDYCLSCSNVRDYAANLVVQYKLDSFFDAQRAGHANSSRDELSDLLESVVDVSLLFELSLREVEQLLARVNIVVRSTSVSESIYPHLLIALLVLRAKEADTYAAFGMPNSSSEQSIKIFFDKARMIQMEASHLAAMVAYLAYSKISATPGDPGSVILTVGALFEQDERLRNLSANAKAKFDQLHRIHFRTLFPLQSLLDRIEMSLKFRFEY